MKHSNHKSKVNPAPKSSSSNRQQKIKKQKEIQDGINRERLQQEFACNYYMMDPLDKNLYSLFGISDE